MFCTNCGAEISENDTYCPYCGVMNYRAAEREYMDKLEDIREDTEKLGGETARQTRLGIRKAGSRALKILLIIAAFFVGFFALGWILDHAFMRSDANSVREEAEFKETYFATLDEYYAAGDDKATADYMNEISREPGSYVMSLWEHYAYMIYYMDYAAIRDIPETELNDDFWKYSYADVLYSGIRLIYQTDLTARKEMSSAEKEKVKEYAAEAEEIFAKYLSLNKSDLDEIYNASVEDDGYLYRSRIYDWAEKTGGNKS